MAQQYFKTHEGVDPAIIKEASEKLERGYKKLIGYECKEGGYGKSSPSPLDKKK